MKLIFTNNNLNMKSLINEFSFGLLNKNKYNSKSMNLICVNKIKIIQYQ